MTAHIHVWEGGALRAARSRASPATEEMLTLLGCEPDPSVEQFQATTAPVGDVLATVALRLAIHPEDEVVTSCTLVERGDERSRVGDVSSTGAEDSLAAVNVPEKGLLVVADAVNPADSMAERLRTRLGPSPRARVIGVLTIGEAAERTLALTERARRGDLIPPERSARARAALFAGALRTSRLVLDWPLVSEVAIALLRHVDVTDETGRFELEIVRDIARRHTGVTAPIAWPEPSALEPYTMSERLTILAHVVQSVADGEWSAVPEYATRALATLEASQSPDALRLRGAVGRALAAVGEYDRARAVLEEALAGWLATDAGEASYALCELLRVEGIRSSEGRVRELWKTVESVLPAVGPMGHPYLLLALGRALAQAGLSKDALAVLADVAADGHAPSHVQTAVQRWRAFAARAMRSEELSAALAQLEHLGESDQRVLAQLDAGGLDVLRTKAHLDALLAIAGSGDEARRLLNRLGPGLSTQAIAERPEIVRRLRVEYRY